MDPANIGNAQGARDSVRRCLPPRWRFAHGSTHQPLCRLMPGARLPIVTVPRMSRCSPLPSAHLPDCLAESAGLPCRILVPMAIMATMVSTASKFSTATTPRPASPWMSAGPTRDISRGGCYVDAFCPFPVNADVKLRLSSEKRSLIAKAKVVCSKTGMGMGLEFRELEAPQLAVLDEWLGELSGTKPIQSESCEAPWEAESEPAVDRTQWYVLHELVVALMRKSLLGHQEGKAMLQKLLEED